MPCGHRPPALPAGTDDVAVADMALANGVVTRPLSRYYQDDAWRQPGLLLGYGHVETEAFAARFHTLAEAIRTVGPGCHTI